MLTVAVVWLEEHEDWKMIRSDGSAAVKSFIFTHYGVDSQFLCHLEKQETSKNPRPHQERTGLPYKIRSLNCNINAEEGLEI